MTAGRLRLGSIQPVVSCSSGTVNLPGMLYHAWIQGAIESGLREAIAIHQIP